MKYTYHDNTYTFAELKAYCIDYARKHPKSRAFYISRTFDLVYDENGELYEAIVVFNRDLEFRYFRLKRIGERLPTPPPFRFVIDGCISSGYARTRDEVISFLKQHPDTHFRLKDREQDKIFGVRYIPETNVLEINRKPYHLA